jgi:hypothetical protein
MRYASTLAILSSVALTACTPAYAGPSIGPATRKATEVNASYDKTWSTVVSHFAERNIQIRTIEKASGIIVAEVLRSALNNHELKVDAKGRPVYNNWGQQLTGPAIYADCGSVGGVGIDPSFISFNMRVLGDGSRSSVRVNMRYTTNTGTAVAPITTECISTGRFEDELERQIKSRAESTSD